MVLLYHVHSRFKQMHVTDTPIVMMCIIKNEVRLINR